MIGRTIRARDDSSEAIGEAFAQAAALTGHGPNGPVHPPVIYIPTALSATQIQARLVLDAWARRLGLSDHRDPR